MSFLELNDVIMLYKPDNESLQVPALRGVNLKLKENEMCAIIGPSGAGKTTMLKLIAGLEKPSSGTIYLDDVGYINQLSTRKLKKYRQEIIGFMYQHPENNLLSTNSALDNVTFPMRILGKLGREERKKKALELLKMLGLENRGKHKLSNLSGGEAQRVAIAIALANDPILVLADEPTGELDTETTFQIIKYLKDLNQDLGTSFVVVTHDTRFSNLTDNTYQLKDGRVLGLHRASLGLDSISKTRENVYLIDQFGNLGIPNEIIRELKFGSEVKLVVNKEKNILEIHPVNKLISKDDKERF